MRTALAVFVAFILLVVGWLAFAALFYSMLLIGIKATGSAGTVAIINVLIMWIIGPGFGGYLAMYGSSRLFPSVSLASLQASFIYILVIIFSILFVFSLALEKNINLIEHIVFIAQLIAIFTGARIGIVFSSLLRN